MRPATTSKRGHNNLDNTTNFIEPSYPRDTVHQVEPLEELPGPSSSTAAADGVSSPFSGKIVHLQAPSAALSRVGGGSSGPLTATTATPVDSSAHYDGRLCRQELQHWIVDDMNRPNQRVTVLSKPYQVDTSLPSGLWSSWFACDDACSLVATYDAALEMTTTHIDAHSGLV